MLRPVHDVENVLGDADFWYAMLVSAAGIAVVWLRLRQHHYEPGVALVVVVAVLVALRSALLLQNSFVVAIALLVLAELVFRARGLAARLTAFAVAGAVVGATLPSGWPVWSKLTVLAVVTIGALVAPVHDRRTPRAVPPLLLISALGIWACVPDTEAPKVLLGAVVAASVIALEPRLRAAIGLPAVVGVVAWVAAFGGVGRPGSIVGGVACLGVLLLPVPERRPGRVGIVVLVATQIALVVYEARVAGFEVGAERALLLSIPAFGAAGLVLWVSGRLARR
jgi:hypothetical protein